jgi:hypothetical protein
MSRGLGYTQACNAYDAMTSVFEDAIVQGQKICVGRVGAVVPIKLEPKVVNMGFSNSGGRVRKMKRQYILGRRLKFKFSLHKAFMHKHDLDWF